jgi:hypothetical protein
LVHGPDYLTKQRSNRTAYTRYTFYYNRFAYIEESKPTPPTSFLFLFMISLNVIIQSIGASEPAITKWARVKAGFQTWAASKLDFCA